jgi:hypothetical protein
MTALIDANLHGEVGEVSYQFRISQTQLVSDMIAHYLAYLKKTRKFKPLAGTAGGFAFQR